jgi:predicted CxxxxCH...CXXCH cytochrome family protein
MQRRGRLVALVAAVVAVGAAAAVVLLRGSSSAAAPRAAPTWKDVAPVFAAKCAGCHMVGGIAPFSLTSAQSAKAHAQSILMMTQVGQMPPWPPGPDSPAYVGSDRRILTAQEKDLIAR